MIEVAVGGMIGSLLLGGLGRRWITQRARRAHVIDTRTAWMRAGQRVHFGPVGAVSCGPLPRMVYRDGVFGALGVTDGRVVFEGHRDHRVDFALPFDRLCRLMLCTVSVRVTPGTSRQLRALALHYTEPDGWRVAVLLADDPQDIARALSTHSDLPVYDCGGRTVDFGPMPATRMAQDIYGEWSEDRDGDLYLAPDRLLFNWRDAIPLDTITRIDVLHEGRGRESASLLRIEHDAPDDADDDSGFTVTGFVVRAADDWADALRHRIDEPIPIFAGRKKKDG
ncbi:MAG: hypothetical protein K8S97_06035 [Anaerolineae bacterium]|nr:hypothetical protein [Anaerolineae bacterium]